MTEGTDTSALGPRIDLYRRRLFHNLRALGVIRARPEELEDLESAMEGALHQQVHPSSDFRRQLRHNLDLAAKQRCSGLAIEYNRPIRQGLILGVSAGLLAAALTAVIFVIRGRLLHAER
jgi:hypothetical protein